MQEKELTRFIPLLGDRIAAINEAKKIVKSHEATESGDEKTKMLEKLRKRLGLEVGKLQKVDETEADGNIRHYNVGNRNASKKMRRLEIGWMNYGTEDAKRWRHQTYGCCQHCFNAGAGGNW